MLIFITAPPQHAVCLLPPAPACGQPLCPCVGPPGAHPSGGCFCSLHGDAWGCRGWQVWLYLFIYSMIILVGTGELRGVRQFWCQLSPENCPGVISMKNNMHMIVKPLKPQASEKRALFFACQILSTKLCLFLIPSLALRVPVKLQASERINTASP